MPDPQLDQNGVPQINQSPSAGQPESVKHTATLACQSIINQVGGGSTGQKARESLLKLSQCMRQHGYPTFPDPNPTTGRLSLVGTGIDTSSARYQTAFSTCTTQAKISPQGG
jgi:hypothetical protein